MQDPILLLMLLLASLANFLIVIYLIRKHHVSNWLHVTHLVPTLIAVAMFYIFIWNGGATIAQYATSDLSTKMWRLWFYIFSSLANAALISIAGNFIFLLIEIFKKKTFTPRANITALGALTSVLAFFAVAVNYPTA